MIEMVECQFLYLIDWVQIPVIMDASARLCVCLPGVDLSLARNLYGNRDDNDNALNT